jgi:hypothetical protein
VQAWAILGTWADGGCEDAKEKKTFFFEACWLVIWDMPFFFVS